MMDPRDADIRNPGTQTPLEAHLIPPPDYELYPSEIESTIDELLDRAISIGEQHSQAMIAGGRGPAPFAHRACTSYHAIEIIRYLQRQLDDIQSAADDRKFL